MPTDVSLPEDAKDGSGTRDSVASLLRKAAAISDPTGEELAFPCLAAGELVAERFRIERLAGRGGMGTVYRAEDLSSGGIAAVKVLARPRADHADRFVREATVLAELSHPAIVHYLAHGRTVHGTPFLAMEWLEGESLGERLLRTGLSVDETLSLAIRVSDALSAAHARGVVHRDVKPSNVFLCGGDARTAKLLDFGVARLGQRPMTRTGVAIGTAGYMAPEQAVGAKDVDARADVFALGCVLYECLIGVPAFAGEQPVAILAKLLHQEPTPLRQLRPEIPEVFSQLVERMLAKERAERPQGGAEVSAALRALGALGGNASAVPGVVVSLTGGERRVLSVLLVKMWHESRLEETATQDEAEGEAAMTAIAEAVKPFAAEVATLQGGVLVVTLADWGAAHDNAARAARCALLLRESVPDAVVALATGRAETADGLTFGVAIDRAASLLASRQSPEGILIDETTAALLDPTFEMVAIDGIGVLHGRSAERVGARRLLGKPTPCVGREKELGLLEATLGECVTESVARAILITAPPGVGKSRLRQEFVARVNERGDVHVLTARADMVRAGSSLDIARQLVRAATMASESLASADQWPRLRSYVDTLETPDVQRVAEFLGELVGAPSLDEPSPRLRSARNNPSVMHEQMRQAFGEWIAAECVKGPLLVVLEDLHWGDAPSMVWLNDALRQVAEGPLMVVALARPEVHETFPKLRSQPGLVELTLGGLTRRAAERLVGAALGNSVSRDAVSRIVERAAGNAFYLEELIRSAAEARTGELPETVLAMVESRIARLEPEGREVLRAASVFGVRFWIEGVRTLMPKAVEWMDPLVEGEMIELSRSTRFAGTTEYAFRHALLRDAAYAMLTKQGHSAAHRSAATWLEQIGETDPLTMVTHHEIAGDRVAAARWLAKAASRARFAGAAVDQIIEFCDRGFVEGIAPELYIEFRRLRTWALAFCARWKEYASGGRELMNLCEPGTIEWISGAYAVLAATMNDGDVSGVADVIAGLSSMRVRPTATRDWAFAVHLLMSFFAEVGQREMALFVKARLDETDVHSDVDPSFLGHRHQAEYWLRRLLDDPSGQLTNARAALRFLEEAGDVLGALGVRSYILPRALSDAGQHHLAGQIAEGATAMAAARGMHYVHDVGVFVSEVAAALSGDRCAPARLRARVHDPSKLNVQSVSLMAELSYEPVDLAALAAAQAESERLLEQGVFVPRRAAVTRTLLALAAIEFGRWSDALCLADAVLASPAAWAVSTTEARWARAQALIRLGRFGEARETIAAASNRLLAQIDGFADASDRAAYLSMRYVSRTLELASKFLGECGGPPLISLSSSISDANIRCDRRGRAK
jgi:hypothetical protein